MLLTKEEVEGGMFGHQSMCENAFENYFLSEENYSLWEMYTGLPKKLIFVPC